MKLVDRIANQVAADLQGTCKGYPGPQELLDALYNMHRISETTYDSDKAMLWADRVWGNLESKVCSAVDESIFLCECCGWWYEQGEQTDNEDVGGNVCQDCGDE